MGKEVIKAAPEFAKTAILEKIFISPRQKFASFPEKAERMKAPLSFSIKEAEGLDFIIDFSIPEASIELARALSGKETLIVCGTTGFTPLQMEALREAAKEVRILYSANFSLGMNGVFKAVASLSSALAGYRIEISEKHHALKKDAPSGTALTLGKIAENSRNPHLKGTEYEEIKYNVVREGEIPGFHEVSFTNKGERIWIGHESFKKEIFANGAIWWGIKAFHLLKSKKNGFFDILSLSP